MQLNDFPHRDDVHIWQVDLLAEKWDALAHVLSVDELQKADDFRVLWARQAYRRCRSALRVLLAYYAGQPAASINFSYGKFGKPEMSNQRWQFNLSHSKRHALIAISPYKVGIDIEFVDQANPDIDGLAQLVCHPQERAALARMAPRKRLQTFYEIWTQKEAYCKLLGTGLQQTLTALHFPILPDSGGMPVCNEQVGRPLTCFVYPLAAYPGYAATVCLPIADGQARLFQTIPGQTDFGNVLLPVAHSRRRDASNQELPPSRSDSGGLMEDGMRAPLQQPGPAASAGPAA